MLTSLGGLFDVGEVVVAVEAFFGVRLGAGVVDDDDDEHVEHDDEEEEEEYDLFR